LVIARRILTLVPGLSGNALWWHGGKIRAVGAAEALEAKVPTPVPRYELPHCLVTPGFTDGHTHFAMWALGRSRVQLAGAATRDAALDRVSAGVPFQGWVLGQGWDSNSWRELPERRSLDLVQSLPVYLDSLDVHAAWVNSAALMLAGISRETPDPYGGRIVRDGNGDPTGILLERAVGLVTPHQPPPSPRDLLTAVQSAQAVAHRLGVTGIHDVEGAEALATFRALETENALRLRVVFDPPVERLTELVRHGVTSGSGTDWLRLGGVKMFLDGSLGSRTAWMLDPYEDGRDRGMPITDEEVARQAMETAAGAGLACTVHAIGDAAVRRALDLMTTLPRTAIPHRIEHFQCVHPDDLARAAAAGIVVSMQPAHLLVDIPLADRHWGHRSRWAYAFQSLLRRGTTVAFGSDVPVATLDPRDGVFAAMERRMLDGEGPWYPEEKMGFEDVVRAYTAANAQAAGLANTRGALAVGMDADLVAWEVDPAVEQGEGAAFRSGHAVLTVVGGEVVMQA
jgi:hypothetical protein